MYTKYAFRSEHNNCGSRWDGVVKMERGQVGKVYLSTTAVPSIPGPVLRAPSDYKLRTWS